MTHLDKDKLIEEIRQLWPKWDWTDATLRNWYGVLTRHAYRESQQAIDKVYQAGEARFQQQLLPVFIKAIKLGKKINYHTTDRSYMAQEQAIQNRLQFHQNTLNNKFGNPDNNIKFRVLTARFSGDYRAMDSEAAKIVKERKLKKPKKPRMGSNVASLGEILEGR